jgi:heme/copper-type cytochrome/quinol oxidase subunit 3
VEASPVAQLGEHPASRSGQRSGARLGIVVFLVADAASFATLLLSYAVLRAGAASWPTPSTRLSLPLAAAMTALLAASSLTMTRARAAAQAERPGALRLWLALTALGGSGFLAGQAYEYHHLIAGGVMVEPIACRRASSPALDSTAPTCSPVWSCCCSPSCAPRGSLGTASRS